MQSKKLDDFACRKLAIRLTIRGKNPKQITATIGRSRQWLHKWQQRFEQEGWHGLETRSRCPKKLAKEHEKKTRLVVTRVRHELQRKKYGFVGARAIRQEIIRRRLLKDIPSLATINRWLKQEGLVTNQQTVKQPEFYPKPLFDSSVVFHLMDWTVRYLTGGEKAFAFHTINQRSRYLTQSILPDKSLQSLKTHVLEVWREQGIPDFLQLDNDSAFTGGERTARRFGYFVRLCLYFGVELIFIPPGEAKRNGLVESVNHLWSKGFWLKDHFRSLKDARKKSQKFIKWYLTEYSPLPLNGESAAKVQKLVKAKRLSVKQIRSLPEELPITEGRIHFIRKVKASGEISLMGESWKVGRRFVDEYVWATVVTHKQELQIHYRKSKRARTRLMKSYEYRVDEKVVRLKPQYRHFKRRPGVLKIF